jgi:ribulose-phosphate 3-epimerase
VVDEGLRRATRLPLDVHLMIEAPDRYLAAFAEAGANRVAVHLEAVPHLHRTIQLARSLGLSPGVALNPGTPVALLEAIAPDLDHVLVMSVNPGFSGQTFIPRSESLERAYRG